MRVALCAAGEIFGGVEQFICSYAQRLRCQCSIEVTVILFHNGALCEKLKRAAITTQVVPVQFKYDPRSILHVARLLRWGRIEVVHTNGYKANIVCSIAARRVGAAVVKTEHGRVEAVLEPRLRSLRMFANTGADQLVTLATADHIVYVASDIAAKLRHIHRGKRTTLIHNAIAPLPESCGNVPAPFSRSHFNVGIVGRLSRVKGHIFLLEAVERLSDLQDLRLYVIGRGPLETDLKEYCIQRGIASKVTFLGFREDIHECMRQLDVLIMPSLHEGVPYVALEAMYLRVPIIASAVGGLSEILSNDENAVLVPPRDPSTLAAAIRRLHDDSAYRKRVTETAFADVTSQFMIEGMVRRYLRVYREAIARASTG